MSWTDFVGVSLFSLTVLVCTPLIVAALGELIIERSGTLNLAIPGMMTLGAAAAFVVRYEAGEAAWGLPLAFVMGAVAGVLLGLLLAYLTVTVKANQVTVGLGLLIFGVGAASVIYRLSTGVAVRTVGVPTIGRQPIPLLADIPVVGPVLFQQNLYVYATLLAVVPISWLLFRTPVGRRIRAAGENPKSVDSLGFSVYRIRYLTLVVGSALIGLAGAFFPLVLIGGHHPASTVARGWLALLLVIFARWRPVPIVFGAFFFAYLDALRARFTVGSSAVPLQIFHVLPYLLAILALVAIYRRAQAPAALARTYDREARE